MDLDPNIQGVLLLIQVAIGSLSNLNILMSYLYAAIIAHNLKYVDVIVSHLAFVHMTSLLLRGVPHIMSLFGMEDVLIDTRCKVVIYLYRVTRSLSISTTCTLSVFQSVTIAAINSWWGKLKNTVLGCLLPFLAGFWIVNLLSSLYIALYSAAPLNNTLSSHFVSMWFICTPYVGFLNAGQILTYILGNALDVLLLCTMILASGHILLTLKRHHQQVQYMHSSIVSTMKAAEVQAMRTIIKLVTLYSFFYTVDILMAVHNAVVRKETVLLAYIRLLFSFCYPCLSPYILISLNRKAPWMLMFRKKKLNPPGKSSAAISIVET